MSDTEGSPSLEEILRVVQERTGIDFRHYRRKTIERRLAGRMLLRHAADYGEYLQRLESDPEEVGRLVERLTIKVSWFFRDTAVFALLRKQAIPEIIRCHGAEGLRVWSAGCGNGEEVYSLAMLLREATPESAWSSQLICGTDIDPRALATAREGVYPASALSEMPPEIAERFVAPEPGTEGISVRVDAGLRAQVRLLVHDLGAAAAPPCEGRFHLLCCRNVLIYFDRELQRHAQLLMERSLVPGGYLCLGEAEWLLPEVQAAFEVIDRRARLFRRRG